MTQLEETLDAIIPHLKKEKTIIETWNRVFRSAVKSAWVSAYATDGHEAGAVRMQEWGNIQYQIGRMMKDLRGLVVSRCDLQGYAEV